MDKPGNNSILWRNKKKRTRLYINILLRIPFYCGETILNRGGKVFSKGLGLALLLFLAAALPAFAAEGPVEVWQATYMLNRISAEVHHDGEAISGVVTVHQLSGENSTYHFSGTMQNGVIVASHRDGYVFRGRLVSQGKIQGVLTTKRGMLISLEVREAPGRLGKIQETRTERQDYADRQSSESPSRF